MQTSFVLVEYLSLLAMQTQMIIRRRFLWQLYCWPKNSFHIKVLFSPIECSISLTFLYNFSVFFCLKILNYHIWLFWTYKILHSCHIQLISWLQLFSSEAIYVTYVVFLFDFVDLIYFYFRNWSSVSQSLEHS